MLAYGGLIFLINCVIICQESKTLDRGSCHQFLVPDQPFQELAQFYILNSLVAKLLNLLTGFQSLKHGNFGNRNKDGLVDKSN